MKRIVRFIIVALGATIIRAAWACDLCGCYTPQLEAVSQEEVVAPFGQPLATVRRNTSWTSKLYLGMAEQFTHFGTLQLEGNEVPNPTDQHLESSITQLVAGYGLTNRLALQLNLPLIYRSFERPEGFAIDRGTESGLGDISLLANFVLFHASALAREETVSDGKNTATITHEPDFTASAVLLAGVKAPTGATDRIKEEFDEIEIPGAPESGIHGHDLALGTGSWDGIFGGQTSLRYQSFFLQANVQFALRGDGHHQYDYANDITWSGGPGYYLVRNRRAIIGLQCVVAGEHKDEDRFRGEKAVDTGITAISVGPRLVASHRRLSAELELDLPVSIDNTALQLVPDYRVQAAISIQF
jgi:hypothetical protein